MSKTHKSTMVELVEELRKLPPPPSMESFYQETIHEAIIGEYHDYKNNKYICGKVAATGRLHQLGFSDLAQRVMAGEFDERADEQDIAQLRKEALEGGFNEAQCKLFGI